MAGSVREGQYCGAQLLGHSDADAEAWLQFGRGVLEAERNRPVVIHDATRNEYLRNIPSVASTPSLRFCAAAPITSDADIPIGYVVVVGTNDHGGFLDHEASALLTIAKQCMSQLEQDYETQVQRRGSRMTEGLSRFLQRQGVVDQVLEEPPTLSGSLQRVMSEQSAGRSNRTKERSKPGTRSRESSTPRPQQPGKAPSPKRKRSSEKEDETPYRRVFRRAADFLRTALDADGVLFADGLVGFHGTLQPAAEPEQELQREGIQADKRTVSEADSETHQDMHSRKFTSTDYRKDVKLSDTAEILGIAMHPDTVKPKLQQLSASTLGLGSVDEGFLQYLMEEHPQGKVWYFDDGPYACEGDSISPDSSYGIKRLAQAFHGSRQLLFVPLKDPVDIKRLAGCFIWSTRVQPMLTSADLSSLDTFSHIVEAEISRIDTIAATKQKESFMASVSHELRSPLHGILAAVDLLLESGLDTFQENMADTIRACGSTLHETLSSLLAYTKINQYERRRDHPRQNLRGFSPWSLENKDLAEGEDSEGMLVPANVAEICEEVMEAVLSSHRSDLAISLTVAYHKWNFFTEPGLLRRIMMNVIGNALKYTSHGGIDISLHVKHNPGDEEKVTGDPPRNIIVFTVVDTGKGMSNAFLENHLFLPFSQEDPMSDGVGLGMSIVKGLVAVLGGEMEVESHVGTGTTVTVSIPMATAEKQTTVDRSATMLRERALKVAASPPMLQQKLHAYLEGWFGCTMVSWADADVAFVAEDERPLLQNHGPAIVVVGKGWTKSQLTRNSKERISEPFGPGKVSKALLRCTKSGRRADTTITSAENSSEATPKKEDVAVCKPSTDQNSDVTSGVTKRPTSSDKDPGSAPGAWSADAAIQSETVANGQPARDASAAILLVEDNHINLRLLQMHVKRKRMYQEIQTAENGLLAVQAVEKRENGFSVIVMDISMPEMDGFEATRQIRGLEQERHQTPAMIIALTGQASAGDRAKAYEAGVDKFLTKPLKFQELDSFLVSGKGPLEQ